METLADGTGFTELVRDVTDWAMIGLGARLTGETQEFPTPIHPDVALLCAAGLGGVSARTRELAAVWIATNGAELLSWSALRRARAAARFGTIANSRIDELLALAVAHAPGLRWPLEPAAPVGDLTDRIRKGLVRLPDEGHPSLHVRLRALMGPTVRTEVVAALLADGRRCTAAEIAWGAMVPGRQTIGVLAALEKAGWVSAIKAGTARYRATAALTTLAPALAHTDSNERLLNWRALLVVLARVDAHTQAVPANADTVVRLRKELAAASRELLDLNIEPPAPARPGDNVIEHTREWIKSAADTLRRTLETPAV